MKYKKGSLLIAITLLSVVLLVILMTIFNLNKKDAELIAIKGDKEKSFQSSNIGLQIAANDIDSQINARLKNNESVTWNDLYNLNKTIEKPILIDRIDNNNNYKYKYKYEHGVITSIGTYRTGRMFGEKNQDKDSDERIYSKTILTANYLLDYIGISSQTIYSENDNGTGSQSGIRGVYSYETQYPMRPWININNKDLKTTSITNSKDLISDGYVTQIVNPLGLYSFVDYYSKDDSSISVFTNSSSDDKNINSLDKMFNMCYALNLKSSNDNRLLTDNCTDYSWMTFYITKELNQELQKGNKKFTVSLVIDILKDAFNNLKQNLNGLNIIIFPRQLKAGVKVYNTLGGYLKDPAYKAKIIDRLGVKENQIEYCLENYKDNIYKLNDNVKITEDGSIKKVYRLVGRNIMLIPLNSTVIIDGDLILEPAEQYIKDYETIYDLNKSTDIDKYTPKEVNEKSKPESYPVLLVTGNLVVNGSIRGVGTVMSMKNIIINNFPYDKEDYKFQADCKSYKEKYYDNPENGAIIVNADCRIAVNSCDVNQLLSQIELSRLKMSGDKVKGKDENKFVFCNYDKDEIDISERVIDTDKYTSPTYAKRRSKNEKKNVYDYNIETEEEFIKNEVATERRLYEEALRIEQEMLNNINILHEPKYKCDNLPTSKTESQKTITKTVRWKVEWTTESMSEVELERNWGNMLDTAISPPEGLRACNEKF